MECFHLVNVYNPDATHWNANGGAGNPAAVAWPTADKALFFPFELFEPTRFVRLYTYNSTVSGNADIGIYTEDGTRIVSTGSVALSGTNTTQSHTIDVTIGPGRFYMGLAHDGVSTSFYFAAAIGGARQHAPRMLGLREMAAAFPLPATATLTAYTATNTFPIFGASRITTI